MNIVEKFKKYFYSWQNSILIILSLGVLFLIVRDVPFLNILFPNNTTFTVIFISSTILLNLYKNIVFLSILAILTFFLYLTESIFQAEQLAILIFVLLSVFVVSETISLFKTSK